MDAPSDPPSIASQTTTVDAHAMHYLAAGSGEPLILIHGYAETSDTWRAIIPALARRWRRVIAPDEETFESKGGLEIFVRSQAFYEAAGSKDKTLKLYEGHFHDLLNDLDREQVMADITEWLAARTAKG